MKRFLKIWTLLCVITAMVGCSPKTSEPEMSFEAYTRTLIPEMMSPTSSVVNALYEHPENYGIIPETYEHNFMSLEDFNKAIEDDKKILETLKKYDYESLTLDEKITYDLLQNYTEKDLKLKELYDVINNNFDVNRGLHAGLTLDLYFYNFRNTQDIDSFIHLLSTADDAFDKYIAFEKERQAKNVGMSATYLKHVIQQVEDFNAGNHDYLLEHAASELAKASFLSEEEKQDYQSKIEDAYANDLLVAYQDLEHDLKQLETPKEDYLSLADYKNGKEYYAFLVAQDAGFTDMEEYRNFLKEKQQAALFAFILYMQTNENVAERVSNNDFTVNYTSLTSMKDVLKYLEDKALTGGNFPPIPALNYEMEVVPQSMQSIFQASAAYFLSPFDSDSSGLENMVLNGEFDPSSYTTLAHEGIPGHMYQHNYFKQIEHNHLRDLLGNTGYQESWATYVSKYMVNDCDDKEMAHVMELNANLSYLYILELDLMIHYDGISTEEAIDFLMSNFGMSEADAYLQYEQLIEGPGIFIPYYAYYFRLMDLKKECQEAIEDLSDYDFHKLMLDLGPLPYELLEKYIKLSLNLN